MEMRQVFGLLLLALVGTSAIHLRQHTQMDMMEASPTGSQSATGSATGSDTGAAALPISPADSMISSLRATISLLQQREAAQQSLIIKQAAYFSTSKAKLSVIVDTANKSLTKANACVAKFTKIMDMRKKQMAKISGSLPKKAEVTKEEALVRKLAEHEAARRIARARRAAAFESQAALLKKARAHVKVVVGVVTNHYAQRAGKATTTPTAFLDMSVLPSKTVQLQSNTGETSSVKVRVGQDVGGTVYSTLHELQNTLQQDQELIAASNDDDELLHQSSSSEAQELSTEEKRLQALRDVSSGILKQVDSLAQANIKDTPKLKACAAAAVTAQLAVKNAQAPLMAVREKELAVLARLRKALGLMSKEVKLASSVAGLVQAKVDKIRNVLAANTMPSAATAASGASGASGAAASGGAAAPTGGATGAAL